MAFTVDLSDVPAVRDELERHFALGVRTGQANIVIKLLEAKFGKDSIVAGTEELFREEDLETLVHIARRVSWASSVKEVFR